MNGRDEDQEPMRLADELGSEAGALLRRMPEPQAWSPSRKQRVRGAIDARLGLREPRRVARTMVWTAFAAACFVGGLFVGRGHDRAPQPATQPLVISTGAVELRGDHVVVREGRVVVQARSQPVWIDVPAQHTSVHTTASGVVEVRLTGWRVQVSAYRGSVDVETAELGRRVLGEGRMLGDSGEQPLDEAVRADIDRALGVSPPAVPATRDDHAPVAAAVPTTPDDHAPVAAALPTTRDDHAPVAAAVPTTRDDRAPDRAAVVATPPRTKIAAVSPREKHAPAAPHTTAPAKLPLDDDSEAVTAPAPVAAPAPATRVVAPVAVPPPSSPPPPSALAREADELRVAVQRLRHDHDPAAALVLLDAYLRRYPHGVLRTEAELARVDALLQTNDRKHALAALDHLSVDGLPRARELRVTRGELRGDAGRCRDAIADFTAVSDGNDPLAERALYRAAACRARLGDATHARADLEDYLARFPEGRFAGEARRALTVR